MLKIKKGDKLLINVFNNISELYNYCYKTPRRSGADKSSETGDFQFTNTRSLEEAYSLLLKGDEKLFKEIDKEAKKIDITKILGNAINRNVVINDVVGFQPNVPNFLMGIPTDMLNNKPRKRSQKIINICYNVSIHCGISHRQVKQAGTVYAKTIDILEKLGYRCNLYILSTTSYNGEHSYCLVRAKTDREPFNLKKMCFMLGNASYDRRVIFKWMESCDATYDMTHGAYGRPITDKETIRKELLNTLKLNLIIWNVQENQQVSVENVLNGLKEQGIEIKDDING